LRKYKPLQRCLYLQMPGGHPITPTMKETASTSPTASTKIYCCCLAYPFSSSNTLLTSNWPCSFLQRTTYMEILLSYVHPWVLLQTPLSHHVSRWPWMRSKRTASVEVLLCYVHPWVLLKAPLSHHVSR